MSSEVEALRAHMTEVLGLDVRQLDQLGISAYNRHYKVVIGDEIQHAVAYNLPEDLPTMGLRFEHAVIRLLQEGGFDQVPRVVVHEGESLFRVGDVYYSLSEWIDGCHDEPELALSEAQLQGAAATLADLHASTAGAELRLDYHPDHVFVYPLADFLDAAHALGPRLVAKAESQPAMFDQAALADARWLSAELGALLADFPRERYDRVRAADPTGIVHGDYRRMNIVFTPDGVSKVLDYNCCFNDIRLWDVAYAALSMAGKETVCPLSRPELASAFIRAYHQRAPLSADEAALLPHMLWLAPAKLMLGAWESWVVSDRTECLKQLHGGLAARIVADALDTSLAQRARSEY